MSQILQKQTKKDSKAQGLATKLHNGKTNNLSIVDVFRNIFFNEPIKNKITNGKSKSKISDYLT